jgi:flagellar FliL protein
MSKAEKPAAAAAPVPKKSKKMLIIIVAAILLIGGGAAAFFLLKPAHPPKGDAAEESRPEVPAKYVELGTFTANLIHEDADRYLQIAISLKLSKPELEEKIKSSSPEILHRVNMLLQSKTPSELATIQGKEKLATDIKGQVEYVIGFRKTPPNLIQSVAHDATPIAIQSEVASVGSEVAVAGASEVNSASAPAEKATSETPKESSSGIAEVLFTSFIIQ